MHEKHGAFYYVFRNKWTSLGRDYGRALKRYADLIAPKRTGGIPDVIDRWLASKEIAASTRKTYAMVANRLKVAFDEFDPCDMKPTHLYQLLAAKKISDGMAQHYRSVMIGAMQLAVKEGLVERNLMREVEQFTVGKRDRYITDAEYNLIRSNASQTMAAIMSISLLTGQRIGDVLSIRYSDLSEDGIVFEQQKTGARLCVAWSDDLRDAVAVARALHSSVKGMTLFHARSGTKYSYSTIRTWWDRAIAKSGVKNAHMHDIRAKTATDAKKQGIDSKALLGHRSDSAHDRYQRGKETPIVQPVKMCKP